MHMINIPPSRDMPRSTSVPPPESATGGCGITATRTRWRWRHEQTPSGPVVVAVVCDGVSSSARPDEASLAAAQAALPVPAGRGAGGRRTWPRRRGPRWRRRGSRSPGCRARGRHLGDHVRLRGRERLRGDLVLAGRQPRLLAGPAGVRVPPAHPGRLGRRGDGRGRPGRPGRGDGLAARARADPLAGRRRRDLADDPDRAPHVERYTPPGAGSCSCAPTACGTTCPRRRTWPRSAMPGA